MYWSRGTLLKSSQIPVEAQQRKDRGNNDKTESSHKQLTVIVVRLLRTFVCPGPRSLCKTPFRLFFQGERRIPV